MPGFPRSAVPIAMRCLTSTRTAILRRPPAARSRLRRTVCRSFLRSDSPGQSENHRGHLDYPTYLLPFLGTAKALGVVAAVMPTLRRLTEANPSTRFSWLVNVYCTPLAVSHSCWVRLYGLSEHRWRWFSSSRCSRRTCLLPSQVDIFARPAKAFLNARTHNPALVRLQEYSWQPED